MADELEFNAEYMIVISHRLRYLTAETGKRKAHLSDPTCDTRTLPNPPLFFNLRSQFRPGLPFWRVIKLAPKLQLLLSCPNIVLDMNSQESKSFCTWTWSSSFQIWNNLRTNGGANMVRVAASVVRTRVFKWCLTTNWRASSESRRMSKLIAWKLLG